MKPTLSNPTILTSAALALLAMVAAGGASSVQAGTSKQDARDKEMLKLDPAERVEQRCNARAMGEVGRSSKSLHPDELVAYAYADTKQNGQHLVAPGAAVRSGSTWYHISYNCETSNDGMVIKSFVYKLGAAIPREEWGAHYLVAP